MQVSGNIIRARIAFVKERFGEAGWKLLLAALSEADRALFGGLVLNISWYPFDAAARFDEAIARVLGKGSFALFEELGRASARSNLKSVHRMLLTPGNPQEFMKKAQAIYSFYYDKGRRTWEAEGPCRGFLTTYEAETFSAADCATVIGWYSEALSLCGAINVRIKEVRCRARGADVCQYAIEWDAPPGSSFPKQPGGD